MCVRPAYSASQKERPSHSRVFYEDKCPLSYKRSAQTTEVQEIIKAYNSHKYSLLNYSSVAQQYAKALQFFYQAAWVGCRQVVRHRVLIPTFRRFESSHSKPYLERIYRVHPLKYESRDLNPYPLYKDNHLKVARLPFRQIREKHFAVLSYCLLPVPLLRQWAVRKHC